MKALVPLDGSELALSVLPNVRRLAELTPGLEIHLLTVIDQKSVHVRAESPAGEIATTIPGSRIASALAPVPRVVESHGEALERTHLDADEALRAVGDGQAAIGDRRDDRERAGAVLLEARFGAV